MREKKKTSTKSVLQFIAGYSFKQNEICEQSGVNTIDGYQDSLHLNQRRCFDRLGRQYANQWHTPNNVNCV